MSKAAKQWYKENDRVGAKDMEEDDIVHFTTIGAWTVADIIISELKKPGRDPRDEVAPPVLRTDVMDMNDLREGMELTGTVRNVIDFGVFVDIGVHQDGLVHISQMSNQFIKDPNEIVKLNQKVKVVVTEVDVERKRISLSMKNIK